MAEKDLVEQLAERFRSAFGSHDQDRRFQLACHAVGGLASISGQGLTPDSIAQSAVQIADATLRELGKKK